MRLLSAALSVNVRVALAVPDCGAAYVTLIMHAPPEGSVIANDVLPFEQAIAPTVNPLPEGIAALVRVSAVEPVPIFETVMICVPEALPKPTLFVEKNTTGAATLISGVTVTESVTVIGSVSGGTFAGEGPEPDPVMVSISTDDVAAPKVKSPLYTAVTELAPAGNELVV